MAQKLNDMLLTELDDIVATSERLSRDASVAMSSLGPDRVEELRAVTTRLGHVLRQLSGDEGQYVLDLARIRGCGSFTAMNSNWYRHVSELAGLAKAAQSQLRRGLFTSVRGLLQAEIFDDFLDMAEHLVEEDYKDAAAVLIGAVLEDTLRKRAAKESLPTVDARGKKLTIDPLNIGLARAGVYNALVQKRVTAWADLRNKAAHGQWGEYDAEQVKQMLAFVRKFCADHLA